MLRCLHRRRQKDSQRAGSEAASLNSLQVQERLARASGSECSRTLLRVSLSKLSRDDGARLCIRTNLEAMAGVGASTALSHEVYKAQTLSVAPGKRDN